MSTSILPRRRRHHSTRRHPAVFIIPGVVVALGVGAVFFCKSQLEIEKRQIAEIYEIGQQADARRRDDQRSRHVPDSKVIYAFTDGLLEDPLEDTYLLTTTTFRDQIGLKDFEAMLREHPLLFVPRDQAHERTVRGTGDYDNHRHVVRVTVSHSGQEVSYMLRLVREADRWLVDGLVFDRPSVPGETKK
jgi:hypothetical protein